MAFTTQASLIEQNQILFFILSGNQGRRYHPEKLEAAQTHPVPALPIGWFPSAAMGREGKQNVGVRSPSSGSTICRLQK